MSVFVSRFFRKKYVYTVNKNYFRRKCLICRNINESKEIGNSKTFNVAALTVFIRFLVGAI